MTDIGPNPFEDKAPTLDAERREKVFQVAKYMKKSCYILRTVWLTDTLDWAIVCTAKIDGQIYESANTLDTFSALDHADLFRMAFSEALKQVEKEKKTSSIILH